MSALLPLGQHVTEQAVGGRHDMPPPLSSLCVRRSASCRRACRPQRNSRFPRPIHSQAHRCSYLTR